MSETGTDFLDEKSLLPGNFIRTFVFGKILRNLKKNF